MSSDIVDEDSMDVEALQAQIDLSMSFAQDLVTSWMDPRKFPASSRRNDLEKELSSYMKRPSRYGVGASIPESHQSISRETARLKGKLVGSNKRPREEDEVAAPKADYDDEHESRATAIKKKHRPDPFDVVHGKKKNEAPPSNLPPALSPQAGPSQNPTQASFRQRADEPGFNGCSPLDASPKKKKRKRKRLAEVQGEESLAKIASTSHQGSELPIRAQTPPPPPAIAPTPSTPPQDLDEVHDELVAVSPATPTSPTIKLAQGKSIPANLLKLPLLNLTGPPPSDEESDYRVAESPPASPKKRRKRKKKKKHQVNGNPSPATPSTAPTIPTS
ncbi:hypothetical protein NLJ89_g96 [Agrocybe chaxingu]|uniref:Uncharacterized protein n=1 Tax=Agrocybe chaxingu TaxID=84603 RepID=A0A9W8N2M8_9AGAR|nr:hypothetical protein NLJ89_g96 [Agrocybe chaxingu]